MSWFSLLWGFKCFLWFSPCPYMFDFSRSGDKLSRALLGEQPWTPSTLYCFPLTRVPPYRFIFNTTGKYNYKLHIYLWQIPIIHKPPTSRQSWGRNAKMFVPPSIFPPTIYPGSYPRFLSQVHLVNLLLNLPANLPTQVASPGTSSRYSLSTQTTVLDGWWQCFLKLLLLFCLRSFLSQSFPSSSSVSCEKYEKCKNRWNQHLQST